MLIWSHLRYSVASIPLLPDEHVAHDTAALQQSNTGITQISSSTKHVCISKNDNI